MIHIQERSKINLPRLKNSSPILAGIINQLSYRCGITYDHALHEILAMASVVASGTMKVRVWDDEYLINEYFLLIAESSEGKSYTQSYLYKEFLKEHAKLRKEYRIKMEDYKEKRKAYDNAVKQKGPNQTDIPRPIKPTNPNILMGNDASKEGLFTEFGDNSVKLKLIRSDDAGEFFEGIGMQDSARFRMMTMLNKLWSNSEVTETKVKHEGTISIDEDEALLNINFAIQGDMFYKHVCNDINKSIGFTARYLMTRAEKLSGDRNKLFGARGYAEGTKYYNEEAERIKSDLRELEGFKKDVNNQLLEIIKNATKFAGETKTTIRELDEKAIKLFANIKATLEEQQGANQPYEHYCELVGKASQHLINLAAIVDWIENRGKNLDSPIDRNTVWTAWLLTEYYIHQHIEMIHKENMTERIMSKCAKRFIKWLDKQRETKEYMSWREMMQNCSTLKNANKEVREGIIAEAVELKYIEDYRLTPYRDVTPVEVFVEENGKQILKLLKSYIKILPVPVELPTFPDGVSIDPNDEGYFEMCEGIEIKPIKKE